MPLRTGPKRRALMASAARRTGVLSLSPPSPQLPLPVRQARTGSARTRAEIAQVENELNSFNQQLDAAVEA